LVPLDFEDEIPEDLKVNEIGFSNQAQEYTIASITGNTGKNNEYYDISFANFLDTPVKTFQITKWLSDKEKIFLRKEKDEKYEDDFLQVLHTPGHTPDGITLYLKQENYFFVGDLFYPRGQILLHLRFSNFFDWYNSLMKIEKVIDEDYKSQKQKEDIRFACGHLSSSVPYLGFKKLVELGNIICDKKWNKVVHNYSGYRQDKTLKAKELRSDDGDWAIALLDTDLTKICL